MIAFSFFQTLQRRKQDLRIIYVKSLFGIMVIATPFHKSFAHIITSAQNIPPHIEHKIDPSNDLNAKQRSIIGEVLASALNFMLPRTLEAYSAEQLCLWGINGLSSLDPAFTLTQRIPTAETAESSETHHSKTHNLVLLYRQEILLDRPMPDRNDLKNWSTLTLMLFQTAWANSPILRAHGVDALLPTFFNEIFNHLDPYSRYLQPNDAHTEREHRQGDSFSVGISLQHHTNTPPTVSAINVNSPAWDHGVDVGQTLLSINGHKTEAMPLHLIYRKLYGRANSMVTLTFKTRSGKIYTCHLRRQALPPETVSEKHLENYLYLKISRFSTQTAEEISQYISSEMPPSSNDNDPLDESPSTSTLPGIILDLRGNYGGVLQQAVITAALFLNNGIAATTEGRNPAANHIWAVQGGDITNNSPIIILVDGQTASAAEVLAAALADRQRAVIIGSSTFGKGLVQIIGQMPNNAEIFITWSRNFAPLGEPIQSLGVMPQFCTSSGNDYINQQLHALKQGTTPQSDLLRQSRMMREPLPLDKVLKLRQHCPAALGNENDIIAALHLLHNPKSYQTALHSVPDETLSASLH